MKRYNVKDMNKHTLMALTVYLSVTSCSIMKETTDVQQPITRESQSKESATVYADPIGEISTPSISQNSDPSTKDERDKSETPEALAVKYINTVNARDLNGLWELIHPRCVRELSSFQREFIDATMDLGFQNTLPEDYSIRIVSCKEEKSQPFGSMAVWPVRPTHRLEVEFTTREQTTMGIARYVAKEEDRWFIVVPLIRETRLMEYAERKSDLDVMGATWHKGAGGVSETGTE